MSVRGALSTKGWYKRQYLVVSGIVAVNNNNAINITTSIQGGLGAEASLEPISVLHK